MNLAKVRQLDRLSLYLYKFNLDYLLTLKARRQVWKLLSTAALVMVTGVLLWLKGA